MKDVNHLLAALDINLNFNLPETNVQEIMCKVCPNLALQLLKKRNEILKESLQLHCIFRVGNG
ncbi:hypothetical protein [Photobacterium phage PDCC-1]|uniref:Uncharacterized protein n=1 Tax=Photobacterium phage PDCC-1 TaxID=2664246 RepID=A0A6B9J4P9_9CAUD|nr:hypothetical protein HWC77_gp065 [Photobacterium phage PDCC-1]QGZ14428.1 hypothetical protein [Photobacterium phage PDCC-1]